MNIILPIYFFVLILLPVSAESLNKDSLPEPVKKAWELIEKQRTIDAINALSGFSPDKASLASYHFTYAKAYAQISRINDAMEHLRLAFIYSQDNSDKELILFERANTYANNKYYDEAALCFKIFLKQFPESKLREEAYLGLAESLYNIGRYNDALMFFQKSGNSFRALYGRADTLHAMGRINEAHEQYLDLINRDKGYIKSQLNSYNIGENFRLMNKFSFAKVYFALVKDYPLKYKAELSSGLIAAAEGLMDAAVRHFELAMQSPERTIKRKALLYLSEVLIKTGKTQEAKARLIEIRNKYPYGKDYDEALLRLAGIYKNEGSFHDAASVLRELVFRKNPDKAALDEFEVLLLTAKNKGNQDFIDLWKTVGQWLLEPSRSEFISKIVRDLKPAGKPYLDACKWLLKHGSGEAKIQGSLLLAEFYAEMGDIATSSKYIQNIKTATQNDDMNRINARLFHLKGEHEKALSALWQIKNLTAEDVTLFINVSSEMPPTLKNHQNLATFLENTLKKIEDKPKFNLDLADVFYQLGKRQDALRHYNAAIAVNEKNKSLSAKDADWCLYRISILSGKNESDEALKGLKKGKDSVNRFANTKSKESSLEQRLKGLF